jgi:hypothetical protein
VTSEGIQGIGIKDTGLRNVWKKRVNELNGFRVRRDTWANSKGCSIFLKFTKGRER